MNSPHRPKIRIGERDPNAEKKKTKTRKKSSVQRTPLSEADKEVFKEYLLYYGAGRLSLRPTEANICWTLKDKRSINEWLQGCGVSEHLRVKFLKQAVRAQLLDWDPEQASTVLENFFLHTPKTGA